VGAEVVAERVETEEEAKILTGLQVQYGQGWLFGRAQDLPTR
jgi:EAL domain-containing protein (putative c-di-GMP-specific phosphodiesterase class I)